ncbi:MAG: hypothetical protein OEV44_08240 [Spirochaetota bacterium]|nr:hypothetical protein [Spirochaetota bacterium]
MENVLCPRCQADNHSDNTFCRICDFHLKGKPPRRKGFIILVVIFVILILASAGTLIYIEMEYPKYGLVKRLKVVKEVLFQNDWIEQHNSYYNLSEKIRLKKIELDKLKNEIETKKDERKNAIKRLEERLKELKKKLDKL